MRSLARSRRVDESAAATGNDERSRDLTARPRARVHALARASRAPASPRDDATVSAAGAARDHRRGRSRARPRKRLERFSPSRHSSTRRPTRGAAMSAMSERAMRAPDGFDSPWSWRALDGSDRARPGAPARALFVRPALHERARLGDLEGVLELLESGEFGVDDVDPGGRTALHFAVGFGRLDVVKELLKRNCALETRDAWRKAPVDFGIQAQQHACVEALRVEAVKRGIWGGKGRVAPLRTYWEHCYGLTSEEVKELIAQNDEEASRTYEKHMERNRKSYQDQLRSRVQVAIEAKARGRKRR